MHKPHPIETLRNLVETEIQKKKIKRNKLRLNKAATHMN